MCLDINKISETNQCAFTKYHFVHQGFYKISFRSPGFSPKSGKGIIFAINNHFLNVFGHFATID